MRLSKQRLLSVISGVFILFLYLYFYLCFGFVTGIRAVQLLFY